MTREYSFTLPTANQWYDLWRDLVAPSITDPTFTNSPYISDRVSFLDIQNQTATSTLQVSDLTRAAGRQITSTNSYNVSVNGNIINLKNFSLKSNLANTVIHVSINSN